MGFLDSKRKEQWRAKSQECGGKAAMADGMQQGSDRAGARHALELPAHVLHPCPSEERWSTEGHQPAVTCSLLMLSSSETTHAAPEKKQRTIFSLSSKDDLKLHQSPAPSPCSHLSGAGSALLHNSFCKAKPSRGLAPPCRPGYPDPIPPSTAKRLSSHPSSAVKSAPLPAGCVPCSHASPDQGTAALETERGHRPGLSKATDLLKSRLRRQIFENLAFTL